MSDMQLMTTSMERVVDVKSISYDMTRGMQKSIAMFVEQSRGIAVSVHQ